MDLFDIVLLCPYMVVAHALLRGRSIRDFLPSLSWLTLMVIPFVYSKDFFSVSSAEAQFIGLAIFSVALILGDKISIFQIPNSNIRTISSHTYVRKLSQVEILVLSTIILIPIIIYFLAGDIPLFQLIKEREYSLNLAQSRAQYTKSENLYFLSILGNWIVTLLGPFLITRFILRKRLFLAVIVFLWIGFYSLSSSAKFPIIVLTMVVSIWFFHHLRDQLEWALRLLVILGITFFTISSVTFANKVQFNSTSCNFPVNLTDTPANRMRVCPPNTLPQSNKVIETLTYRVFLTPIEVSNHWYQEFSTHEPKRSIFSLLKRDLHSSTPNKIGIKYYYEVFGPVKYTKEISAYASMDADAYSIGGNLLSIVVAMSVLIIRRLMCHLSSKMKTPTVNVFAITFFTCFPSITSFQALLFSQGLVLLLVCSAMLALSYKNA